MKVLSDNERKITFLGTLIYMFALFSTMPLISIKGYTLYIILLYFIILFVCFFSKKLKLIKIDKIFIIYYISMIITTVGSFFSEVGDDWKVYSIKATINIGCIILIISFLCTQEKYSLTNVFFKGLKMSVKIQIIWCIIQILLYKTMGIDINNLIFVQLLKTTDQASQFKNGTLVCSGLCENAGNLVVILILYFLFNKDLFHKLICIIITFLSGNSTAEIAILICIVLELGFMFTQRVKSNKLKLNNSKVISYIVFIGIALLFILIYHNIIFDQFNLLISRIMAFNDNLQGNSSRVHFLYYSRFSQIFINLSVFKKLFGYGINCSGYPFSYYYNQYVNSVWCVESDYINIILGQGLIGVITYFIWYIQTVFRAAKVNFKYEILFISIAIAGIFYNVQYLWVIMLELFLAVKLKEKIDILHLKKN